MHVLVTCKNEEDPFKNEGAYYMTMSDHNNSLIISLREFLQMLKGS